MEYIEFIKYVATLIVVWVLGKLSKKSDFINNNFIPIQNISIGVIVALVNYLITKDKTASLILLTTGFTAGGGYDVLHGIDKVKKGNQEWQDTIDEKVGE